MYIHLSGKTVVFRINGNNINFASFNSDAFKAVKAIFYFPDATAITTQAVAIWGSFIAPKAAVTAYNGQSNGPFYVKSILPPPGHQPTMQINLKPITMDCQVSCTGGQVFKDNRCQCPLSSQRFLNGKCTGCGVNQIWRNNQCECTIPGQSIVNGICQCPNGQKVIGDRCTGICPIAGQILQGGNCFCPYGQAIIDNMCKCVNGQIWRNNQCECPAFGQRATPQGCKCPDGLIVISDKCTCPKGEYLVYGRCGTCQEGESICWIE